MRRALLVLLLAGAVFVGYVVLRDLQRGYRSSDGATLLRFTLHSHAVGSDLHEILELPAPSTTPPTSGGTTCSPRRGARRSTAPGSGSTWAPTIPSAQPTPCSRTGCSGRTSSSSSTSGPVGTAAATGSGTWRNTLASTPTRAANVAPMIPYPKIRRHGPLRGPGRQHPLLQIPAPHGY